MIRQLFLLVGLLYLSWLPRPPAQQPVIDTPLAGEALQGQVVIHGTTDVEGFQSYEVSFAYQQDPTNTWFSLYQGKETVKDGALATWDTTTISDGDYRIRVLVYVSEGQPVQTIVSGLRVRNYSVIETATPAPAAVSDALASPTAADYVPTDATAAPGGENPAGVERSELGASLAMGGLIALGLFIILGIYLAIRALFRRF